VVCELEEYDNIFTPGLIPSCFASNRKVPTERINSIGKNEKS
jgi:hypothetical protein